MLATPRSKAVFASEADLCQNYIRQLPKGWTAYPETAEFDIVLVRDLDGLQIGVEAKLTLNAKVIEQATMNRGYYRRDVGPDHRAVLIPWGSTNGLLRVCHLLGITVIEMRDKEMFLEEKARKNFPVRKFMPDLPDEKSIYWGCSREWFDFAPTERLKLPAYVPDVKAGKSAPVKLTEWKIKAIKLMIVLEKRGYVTGQDCALLEINKTHFLSSNNGGRLSQGEKRGQWVKGPTPLDLRKEHPRNYVEIEAAFPAWGKDLKDIPA